MPDPLTPPPESIDPFSATWLTPGGPLPDPERDDLDPQHVEPVEVLDPVPPELADPGDTTPAE